MPCLKNDYVVDYVDVETELEVITAEAGRLGVDLFRESTPAVWLIRTQLLREAARSRRTHSHRLRKLPPGRMAAAVHHA